MKIKENDWHKSFHDRELVEAFGLSAEERGCYYTIRNLIFRELGHFNNDDAELAKHCGLTPRQMAKVKAKLLKRKIFYVVGTSLRSLSADKVIEERMARRKKAQKSGRAGGQAKARAERTKADTSKKRGRVDAASTVQEREPQLFEEPTNSSVRYSPPPDDPPANSGKLPRKSGKKDKSESVDNPDSSNEINGRALANASPLLGESKNLRTEEQQNEEDSDSVVVDLDDLTEDAVEAAFAAYNEAAGESNDWPKATAMTPKRKRALAKLLNEEATGGLTGWRTMLAKATASDWLAGRTTRKAPHENWRASLDYFVRLDVFIEVMEGRHDNRQAIVNRAGKRDGASAMGEALKRFYEEDTG